jgi:hypothetical protein
MMEWLRKAIAAIVLISFSCVAFANPPSESGVVTRTDETEFFFWWYDEENNTTAYFGVEPLLACYGDPNGWQSVPVMRVFMDTDGEDVLRFKNHVNSNDMLTSVWPGFAPPFGPGNVCSQIFFFGVTPIATGYSRVRVNDNDVLPGLNPNRRNANAFGLNAHGDLVYFDSGEPVRFWLSAHAVWDGENFDTYRAVIRTRLR